MRLSIRFLVLLLPALTAVVLASMWVMYILENRWVSSDLSHRSKLVADTVEESISSYMKEPARGPALKRFLNRICQDSRLTGVLACSNVEREMGRSDAVPKEMTCEGISKSALSKPNFFYSEEGKRLHRAVYQLVNADLREPLGYLLILHDPSYMAERGSLGRKYAVILFIILAFLIAMLTIFIHRWSVSQPLAELTQTMRAVLKGGPLSLPRKFSRTEFAPLVRNLNRVLSELQRAKTRVGGELSENWSAERLRDEIRRLFGDARLCIVANREPYIHNRRGTKIEMLLPASGLVSAMEPIVRACSGLWIGHGSGTADKETADKNGVILVPPAKPEYALKRVWLTKEEEQGYYYGFANEGLWPLCHIAHTRPTFREEDWKQYYAANQKFAKAFHDEMKSSQPIALVQDYHFALLPKMLRADNPNTIVSLFWHIPWPNPESIGICPWKYEILSGMVASDLIGFHTQYHCNNFLDTIDRYLEARVDRSDFSVTIQGHTCYVKPFPISIEWPPKHTANEGDTREMLLRELSIPESTVVALGVDRLDYTKGITERFLAVEKLLERYPDLIGKFTLIQIAAPSRTHIKRYQDLQTEIRETADRINFRYQHAETAPIHLRISHHDGSEVFRYYRTADICLVTSLHDGMNLVSKEFVASRTDDGGVLILSSFAGAAQELPEALVINPYDTVESAEAIRRAIEMPIEEKRARMRAMRNTVAHRNVYQWASQFLSEVHAIRQKLNAVGT